jgi:hypothetical protein
MGINARKRLTSLSLDYLRSRGGGSRGQSNYSYYLIAQYDRATMGEGIGGGLNLPWKRKKEFGSCA